MEITHQWFAGFVDGEGSIMFRTYTNKKGYTRFVIQLSVSNTHLPTLEAIKDKFGGSLCKANKRTATHRQAYMLAWAANQAIELLKAIHPYMVTKKDQVTTLLAAYKPGPGAKRLTPEVIEQRMQAISEMQGLRKMEYLQ